MEKKKAWFDEQLVGEQERRHQLEIRLNNEMGKLEELHAKESQLWAGMRSTYEEAAAVNQQEIANLKKSVEEARNRCQAITDNVRILLQTNRERFTTQLKTALDKGWMAWAAQAAELHTYRADWENRRKDGRGFYKLNEESIAAVREDLAQDYRTLADQHSEELA
mgnify:FL=1